MEVYCTVVRLESPLEYITLEAVGKYAEHTLQHTLRRQPSDKVIA